MYILQKLQCIAHGMQIQTGTSHQGEEMACRMSSVHQGLQRLNRSECRVQQLGQGEQGGDSAADLSAVGLICTNMLHHGLHSTDQCKFCIIRADSPQYPAPDAPAFCSQPCAKMLYPVVLPLRSTRAFITRYPISWSRSQLPCWAMKRELKYSSGN